MVRELNDADPVSGLGPDDPCWCGSALAHVACHGDPLPPSEPGAPITEADDDALVYISPTATVDWELVFPSAYLRGLPTTETPKGDGVVFRFEGPVQNLYATLIVRLARSNLFTRVATWRSAARFAANTGECTVFLSLDGEGEGELRIGFDRMPTPLRRQFERFVHAHLERRATPGTVTRERRYSCPRDGTAFTSEQVEQVVNLGRPHILCPVCENRVSLRDDYELANGTDQSTAAMDASADAGREAAAASAVLRGKEEVQEFDVFLCHDWRDKPAVRRLAERLRERGLRPWLDERELRPGLPWQPAIEDVIASIPAAALIVGSRVGPGRTRNSPRSSISSPVGDTQSFRCCCPRPTNSTCRPSSMA
jgi:nucleotide-binding universal stress UspA family protein